ncbi:MAG: hypothetical protein GY928_17130, partial [Colwellia sp.]|nr:hypothetical protein [Colwellia sp.]
MNTAIDDLQCFDSIWVDYGIDTDLNIEDEHRAIDDSNFFETIWVDYGLSTDLDIEDEDRTIDTDLDIKHEHGAIDDSYCFDLDRGDGVGSDVKAQLFEEIFGHHGLGRVRGDGVCGEDALFEEIWRQQTGPATEEDSPFVKIFGPN